MLQCGRRDNCQSSFLKQFGMRARTHKDDDVPIQPVDQQKVATDVTFPVVSPVPLQWMIEPLGAQRRMLGHNGPSGKGGPSP